MHEPFVLERLIEPTWIAVPVGENDMKQFNQFAWVNFGQVMAPLLDLEPKPDDVDKRLIFMQARRYLHGLLFDEIVPLDTCKQAAKRLRDEIAAHVEYLEKTPEEDRDVLRVMLTESRIKSLTSEFLSILNAELDKLSVYHVVKKRIYDTNDLILRGHKLFSESVCDRLPATAKTDVDASGKCLAFELPTAAAFHILRASESVMGLYYQTLTKGRTFKDDKIARNWGSYIKALSDNGAEKKITEFLDHIRAAYRNPITHPEDVVTLDESLDLFNAEISSISQIITQVILLNP